MANSTQAGSKQSTGTTQKQLNSSQVRPSLYFGMFEVVTLLYSGKNVFITGGTGYLGRVLIWKLLTYCPDIGKVYLLMREKKGVCQEKRLEDMKGHFMFQGIEKNIPGQLDKMHFVQGNIQEIGIGL